MARPKRSAASYRRREAVREPYDRVLLVCEGKKTEPYYFEGLRIHYALNSVNISIRPADGSDPVSIVQFALRHIDEFDRGYCVFDRDEHANFDTALTMLRESQPGQTGKLTAIPSFPCFEIWPLLHFRYSTAEIYRVGRQSPGDVAVRELSKFIPGYTKGHSGVFRILLPTLPVGMRNAAQLERDNIRTRSNNPGTKLHRLVHYLMHLRD
jgi:hypothetical protein